MNSQNILTINNNGIFSAGDNAHNSINHFNSSLSEIDWVALEKELVDLKKDNSLESIKNFADQASSYVKKKNLDGLIKCFQNIGKVGLEIISKSSATILAELIKKSMGM